MGIWTQSYGDASALHFVTSEIRTSFSHEQFFDRIKNHHYIESVGRPMTPCCATLD